jgi:catechol 2,3-dioxygenase-like lactoylglutathione lyase family enzyme
MRRRPSTVLLEIVMKRFHVHVAVDNLGDAIGFYSALFAAQPSVVKPDYAKWMLDDPRVNFAISARGCAAGLDHLGIQVEDQAELHEVYGRLDQAGRPVLDQGETQCCYARSEKSWVDDPAGISWEAFLTTGESTNYGDGSGERGVQIRRPAPQPEPAKAACCGPKAGPVTVEASACCSS